MKSEYVNTMAGEENVAELIRAVMDGRDVQEAMKRLIRVGGAAVEPICHAVAGNHGRVNHPDRLGEAIYYLTAVLVEIAKRDSESVAQALSHEVPAENLVVWALGHSDNDHATKMMQHVRDGDDLGMQAVARFHRPD